MEGVVSPNVSHGVRVAAPKAEQNHPCETTTEPPGVLICTLMCTAGKQRGVKLRAIGAARLHFALPAHDTMAARNSFVPTRQNKLKETNQEESGQAIASEFSSYEHRHVEHTRTIFRDFHKNQAGLRAPSR